MDEREWMASDDVRLMLAYASDGTEEWRHRHRISERTLRLLACACCEFTGMRVLDDGLAIAAVAGSSENLASNWARADANAGRPTQSVKSALFRDIAGNPFRPVTRTHDRHCGECHLVGAIRPHCRHCGGTGWVERAPLWLTPTVIALAQQAYDERSVRFGEAYHLAGVPCRDRIEDGTLDPQRLLVLSDALEDAGCTEPTIMRHLRGWDRCVRCGGSGQEHNFLGIKGDYPCDGCKNDGWVNGKGTGWQKFRGPHVRGCWVLDLILGKE